MNNGYKGFMRGAAPPGERLCRMELLKIDPSAKALIASGLSPSDELHKEINPPGKGFVHKLFGMTQLLESVGSVLRDK